MEDSLIYDYEYKSITRWFNQYSVSRTEFKWQMAAVAETRFKCFTIPVAVTTSENFIYHKKFVMVLMIILDLNVMSFCLQPSLIPNLNSKIIRYTNKKGLVCWKGSIIDSKTMFLDMFNRNTMRPNDCLPITNGCPRSSCCLSGYIFTGSNSPTLSDMSCCFPTCDKINVLTSGVLNI